MFHSRKNYFLLKTTAVDVTKKKQNLNPSVDALNYLFLLYNYTVILLHSGLLLHLKKRMSAAVFLSRRKKCNTYSTTLSCGSCCIHDQLLMFPLLLLLLIFFLSSSSFLITELHAP